MQWSLSFAQHFPRRGMRVLSFISTLALSSASLASYSVTDLGNFGALSIQPLDINNSGQVIAFGYQAGGVADYMGYLYSNGAVTALGVRMNPTDINDNGDVVGYGWSSAASAGPFIYSGGSFSPTGPAAAVINNSGSMAGDIEVAGGNRHAALNSNGVITDLGTLGGGNSLATAINNNGDVVGWAQTDTPFTHHAFLYASGLMIDLGTLGYSSEAVSLNDHGQVVGFSGTDAGYRAFVYQNGLMTSIGTLSEFEDSYAYDINNNGQAVGRAGSGPSNTRAFLYENGQLFDLNTLLDSSGLGWNLQTAVAINDHGQILGGGYIDGEYRLVILTPVPVPAGAWLFGSGLIGLLGVARRRR
jgi:probable HAF family extracellular repeat protein